MSIRTVTMSNTSIWIPTLYPFFYWMKWLETYISRASPSFRDWSAVLTSGKSFFWNSTLLPFIIIGNNQLTDRIKDVEIKKKVKVVWAWSYQKSSLEQKFDVSMGLGICLPSPSSFVWSPISKQKLRVLLWPKRERHSHVISSDQAPLLFPGVIRERRRWPAVFLPRRPGRYEGWSGPFGKFWNSIGLFWFCQARASWPTSSSSTVCLSGGGGGAAWETLSSRAVAGRWQTQRKEPKAAGKVSVRASCPSWRALPGCFATDKKTWMVDLTRLCIDMLQNIPSTRRGVT